MTQKLERVFSFKEQFRNIRFAAKSFVLLKKSKKYKLMNKKLKERIMLSITEVNGCTLCSFVHTKVALGAGMSKEDIKAILDGNHNTIPVEDAVAVMFSQEFAYSKENPSSESINRLVSEYGIQKAELVLAASNVITMTNGMGIAMGMLVKRIRFKRDKRSKLAWELGIPLSTMVFFPLLVLYNMAYCFFKDVKLLTRPKTFVND